MQGVGNVSKGASPIQPLSLMRGTDAVCAQYNTPAGVAFSFHVSIYSIEPTMLNCIFNLFAKDIFRAALFDEIEEGWPQIPLIGKPFLLSGGTECLTGARACPDRTVCIPSGKLQRVTPSGDAGEKVTLGKSSKVIWCNICDTPFINFTGRYQSPGDQLPQPSGGVGIKFIVVIHWFPL